MKATGEKIRKAIGKARSNLENAKTEEEKERQKRVIKGLIEKLKRLEN